jgi:hypothetical protein
LWQRPDPLRLVAMSRYVLDHQNLDADPDEELIAT